MTGSGPTWQAAPSTDEFLKGLWRENPVFVQVLGMCPTLAVTNTAQNGLAMGLATTFVLLMSNILISSLRNVIPKQVRIASYLLIIATFVTMVDYLIQAISVELYKVSRRIHFLDCGELRDIGQGRSICLKKQRLEIKPGRVGNGVGIHSWPVVPWLGAGAFGQWQFLRDTSIC